MNILTETKEGHWVRRQAVSHLIATHKAMDNCMFTYCKAKWYVLLTQYCAGDKIEKNEMGWACDACGCGEGGVEGLGGETGGKETTGET